MASVLNASQKEKAINITTHMPRHTEQGKQDKLSGKSGGYGTGIA